LKFLPGIGTYSWGFASIIEAHPEIAGKVHRFRGFGDASRGDHTQRNNEGLSADYGRLDEGEVRPGETEEGLFARDVLCGSTGESWRWQERVIRFMLERYDIDGFHTESADLGRCMCEKCRRVENVAYHAAINERTNHLIKELAPEKTLAVNTGLEYDGMR